MSLDPWSDCLLCTEKQNIPDPPHGMSYRVHAYLYGFADGVRCARDTIGPKLCRAHQDHLAQALAARGIATVRRPDGD